MRSLLRTLPALIAGACGLTVGAQSPQTPGAFTTADGKPQATFTFLEPGFKVDTLPVGLPAINNVAYATDGRLFAAGYDGRIWLLKDTDGDGLEDRATLFWEGKGDYEMPLGMVVKGDSVYVTLRRRIERLQDTQGAGVADRREVVATGWHQEITEKDPTFQHRRVDDAIGLAIDDQGRFYTSLGTPNHANGWQVDATGASRYRLDHFRGSVLRVAPGGRPELIATGLRFAVALQFNRHGDLFATDQEGYTWGPGNPFDELVQIMPGRHYGFPPRHPKWLPDVEDTPSVVDFGPMHQSTCGFCFDETKPGWKRFGPAAWEDNALVTGEARGKLWRVPLTKTRGGYLGRPILIGRVNLLPIDVCTSPRGDLVVACHGGKPDWGNGPKAEGRLYKVRYVAPTAPAIAATWLDDATTVQVALTQPLPDGIEPTAMSTGGRYVHAGDELETFVPGYKVITNEQKAAPTYAVKVLAISVDPDRRQLTLRTTPHPWRCGYGLRLRLGDQTLVTDYGFGGVRARWTALGADRPGWQGWLPHPNLDASRQWTSGSATHAELFRRLGQAGRLELDGALEARPLAAWQEIEAVERVKVKNSGSLALPDGAQEIELVSATSGRWSLGAAQATLAANEPSMLRRAAGAEPVPFHIEIQTGGTTTLTATQRTDRSRQPLHTQLSLVPDAPATLAPGAPLKAKPKGDWKPGDVAQGKALFTALCQTCHTFRGQGTLVGPDLTNSPERDPLALRQDIVDPNASLNPDHIGYELTLRDGRIVVGVIASDRPGRFLLRQPGGVTIPVEHGQIAMQRQLARSLMPEGFGALGEDKLRDLLTYLTTPAGK